MRFRKAFPFIAIYLVAALSIPVLFSSAWLKPIPEVSDLYDGPLSFSGDRAYSLLETLVLRYPDREVGSVNARLSARWVAQELESIGLDAEIETFDVLIRNTALRPDQVFSLPVTELTHTVPGDNVVAVSPGLSDEVILIGAHRDIYGTIQGAEDNGSGTACMLELARVLTAEEHRYTYAFVSFDGEEVGLRGSDHFAQAHPEMNIKLAISLDMTGYAEADTVGFYPFVSSLGASPLWTQALARSLCKDMGLSPYLFPGTESPRHTGALARFVQAMYQRTSTRVPTDSGPFVDRNVPALGVMAGLPGETFYTGGNSERYIHTERDSLENISADTLGMVGTFVERYIKSIELNRFSGDLASSLYFVEGDQVLGALPMTLFASVVPVLAVSLALVTWLQAGEPRRDMLRFLRREWIWLGAIGAASLASAYLMSAQNLFRARSLTAWYMTWGFFTLLSAAAICYLRFRSLRGRSVSPNEELVRQKTLLTWLYAVVAIGLAFEGNPFMGAWTVAFHVFVLGRVDYRRSKVRKWFAIAALVWGVPLLGSKYDFLSRVWNPTSVRSPLVSALGIAAWMASLAYILAAPPEQERKPLPPGS